MSLQDTALWFNLAVPTPTAQNFTTQLGVHYEEVCESLEELTPNDLRTSILIQEAAQALSALADHLKANAGCVVVLPEDQLLFLDALADQIVTATGTGYMLGFNVPGALDAVNVSNFSKFVDGLPIFNENMKVMKGPDYVKPELTPYLKRT
jgi:predicted HAD superfamily Cof-like phosphohydrolase